MLKKTAPGVWDSKPFCRCVKVMARRCFVSILRPVLPGSSACSRVISIHNGRLSAFSHRAPMAPCRRRQTWMKSAKRIWQRYLSNNRTALITCWGIPLYAGAGYCGATACPWRTGGISWLAGYLAARNAKLAGKRS